MGSSDSSHPLVLRPLEPAFAVCRLPVEHAIEAWMQSAAIWSITRTPDELSIVCPVDVVPTGVRREGPFGAFMVEGPLDFALTGILSRLSGPLASAGIPIFVVSTFDTDYILVPAGKAPAAIQTWSRAGITVR